VNRSLVELTTPVTPFADYSSGQPSNTRSATGVLAYRASAIADRNEPPNNSCTESSSDQVGNGSKDGTPCRSDDDFRLSHEATSIGETFQMTATKTSSDRRENDLDEPSATAVRTTQSNDDSPSAGGTDTRHHTGEPDVVRQEEN
jgi:hypothetical protein